MSKLHPEHKSQDGFWLVYIDDVEIGSVIHFYKYKEDVEKAIASLCREGAQLENFTIIKGSDISLDIGIYY